MRLTITISKTIEQILLLLILTLVFLYDAFSEVIGFLDEFTALLSLIVILFFVLIKGKIRLYRKEYYIFLLLGVILTIGLASNFFTFQKGYKTDKVAIIGDCINFFKAFIVYFAVRLLSNSFDSKNVLNKLAKYCKYIFYILFVFVVLDFIFNLFPHPARYGIYAIELFFQHASRYGFAFSFIFLVLLPKFYFKKKSFLFLILFVGLLSLRVKYFGFVTLSVIFMYYGKILFKIPKLYFLSIISSLGLLMVWLFWEKFEMYFTFENIEEAWSRAVVLYYSFIIGIDYFPLGTGFGTFSSYYSGLHYSWVYDLYGISDVYGIKREFWNFISDQYWPMILGQFGYFGLLSMGLVIYNYFTLFMTNIKANRNNIQYYYYYLSAILGLLLLLIDSTSDAIFSQQRAVVLFIYFALVVNSTKGNYESTTNK